ncbi:hypothetical protein B0T16DRAFT_394231 [Cercophora newfieldiana]|uniref:Uncharacterized protein n=1 Tax=Cercophora newfieldiana TaxID=92897 RepID=A0AA39XYD3_9PEZI|nr:hypothetical protein B0T16DRAFT_394231 [Cercophora newfieldiana]
MTMPQQRFSLFSAKKSTIDQPEASAPVVRMLGKLYVLGDGPHGQRAVLHVELVCAPSDRPRHVRNLRLLCAHFLDIRTEDLPMPGIFLDALQAPEVKDSERIYFVYMRIDGWAGNLKTTRSDNNTAVVMPLLPIEGPDGWGAVNIDSATYQVRWFKTRVIPAQVGSDANRRERWPEQVRSRLLTSLLNDDSGES